MTPWWCATCQALIPASALVHAVLGSNSIHAVVPVPDPAAELVPPPTDNAWLETESTRGPGHRRHHPPSPPPTRPLRTVDPA